MFGCSQGNLEPPRSRARRPATMANAKSPAPRKSMRASLLLLSSASERQLGGDTWGRKTEHSNMEITVSRAWPVNDLVSFSNAMRCRACKVLPSPSYEICQQTAKWGAQASPHCPGNISITSPTRHLTERNEISNQNRDQRRHASSASSRDYTAYEHLRQ